MSNLASVIMEGVQATHSTDDLYGNYDFSGSAVAESTYMTSACATLFGDIMEADQSYMVADVIGAATVIRESKMGNAVDVKAVTEGVVKNGIEKLKAAFQKFIAKVKEYYKRVVDWFKAMFSNSADFVKNYGDMIKKKAGKVKDFHYTGYKYTISAGDSKAEGFAKKVEDHMNSLIGDFDIAKDSASKQEFHEKLRNSGKLSADFDGDKQPTSSEEVEKFINKNSGGSSDTSELRKDLIEAYRDGDDKTSDIKDFEANGVGEMLDFLKNSSKTISKFENQLKKFEDKTNKVIQKLNSFSSKDGEEGGENLVSNASYISGLMSAFLNLYKVPCEVQISVYKTISHDFLGALKKFYNFKGNAVKEAAEVYDAEAFATLESSLVLEGEDAEPVGTDPKEPEGDVDKSDGKATSESAIASILESAAQYTF